MGLRKAVVAPKFKRISGTFDLASPDGTVQTIAGVGFSPKAMHGCGAVNGTVGSYSTLNGICDGARNQSCFQQAGTGNYVYDDYFFIAIDATSANKMLGVVTAIGADGISITWSKVGAPAGTFAWAILFCG